MAEREVLKEFLAKLGFEVDQAKWQKFSGVLKEINRFAERAGEALVAAGTAAAISSDRMAKDLQKLRLESQRAGSTVKNLQAIGFAAEKIGMSGEGVQGLVTNLRMLMRAQPGLGGMLKNFGINPGEDTTKILDQLVAKLGTMPRYLATQYGSMFGIDQKTLANLLNNYRQFIAAQKQGLVIQREMGVDSDRAAVAGNKYAQSLTEIGQRVYTLREGLMIALMPAMKAVTSVINDLLKRFMQWVGANKKLINTRVIEYVNGLSSALQKIPWHAIVAGVKRFGSGLNWLAQHVGGWQNLVTGFLIAFTANAIGLTGALSGLATALIAMFALLTPGKLAILGAVAAGVGIDFGLDKLTQHATKGKEKTWEQWVRKHLLGGSQFGIIGGGGAETSAGRLPLGLRNNNPGNLQPGGKEATYPTMQAGLTAMARLLLKYSAHGTNTIRKIISKYAPPSENPTGSYIRNVSASLGIDPDKALDLAHHPEMLARLQGTMIRFEQGQQPFSGAQLLGAAHAAGSVVNNNITSTATVHVDGSRSPQETARAVEQRLSRVNADIIHNLRNPAY